MTLDADKLVSLAVNTSNSKLLLSLLYRIPNTVKFEPGRHAIQIADCSGNRIANYSLKGDLLAAATAEVALAVAQVDRTIR